MSSSLTTMHATVLIMWVIYITCISTIIHNIPTDTSSGGVLSIFLNLFAWPALLVVLLSPVYYIDKKENIKPVIHIAMMFISLLLFLITSQYDEKEVKEPEKLKNCQNAANTLFALTIVYYGGMTVLYYNVSNKTIQDAILKALLD
jgi:hypothetical protein